MFIAVDAGVNCAETIAAPFLRYPSIADIESARNPSTIDLNRGCVIENSTNSLVGYSDDPIVTVVSSYKPVPAANGVAITPFMATRLP